MRGERDREPAALVGHALRAGAPRAVAAERQRVGDARGLDAGNLLHAAQHFVEVGDPLLARRVAAVRDRRESSPRAPAGSPCRRRARGSGCGSAARRRPAARTRTRSPTRPARCAPTPRCRPSVDPRVASFSASCSAALRALQRRRQAEHDAGERCAIASVKPSAVASVRTSRSSGMLTASEPRQRARAGDRQDQPEQRARAGQHDAFGQHLRHQPAAAGAERGADRDLLLPRRGPRQQQVREVGADDQHDHADRAGEHPAAPAACGRSPGRPAA